MKKLYIETYGCQMNVADSEVVAAVMQMAGYEMCQDEADADAIFMNTCSVRENAENKIYKEGPKGDFGRAGLHGRTRERRLD